MNDKKFLELIAEYIDLVEFLKTQPDKIYRLEDGNIGVSRQHIRKLLEKYSFLEIRQKLKLYKTLNLIVTDKDLYTSKRVIIKNNERVRERLFIINMKTYNTLNVNL